MHENLERRSYDGKKQTAQSVCKVQTKNCWWKLENAAWLLPNGDCSGALDHTCELHSDVWYLPWIYRL